MAKKTTRQGLKAAKKGKAAAVKKPKEQAKADTKAAHGEVKPLKPADIEEVFRRFQAANPVPKGELQHINPFTLLVAVVLSAQATDAGVNKATPALFAAADTPEKMVKLGEAKVRDLIKTIGLFRGKAKNIIALSKKLIAEHDSEVPRTREALRSATRRRAQDRQCRAQHRVRRADHGGRYACLSRRQSHRPCGRKKSA